MEVKNDFPFDANFLYSTLNINIGFDDWVNRVILRSDRIDGIDFTIKPTKHNKKDYLISTSFGKLLQASYAVIPKNDVERLKGVYLIKCGKFHKIGVSCDVERRIKEIRTSNAEKVSIIVFHLQTDALALEKMMHKKFKKNNKRGEWFELNELDIEWIAHKISKMAASTQEISEREKLFKQRKDELKKLQHRKLGAICQLL